MSKQRKVLIIFTAVNLTILILLTVCMLRIRQMHQEINAATDEFHYTETANGEVNLNLGPRYRLYEIQQRRSEYYGFVFVR